MTNRQKKIGVTEYGYQHGCKMGEWMRDSECFLAKAATIRKGQYRGYEIAKAWFAESDSEWSDILTEVNWNKIQGWFYGLSVNFPDNFHYTGTLGLDVLTVK